MSLDYETGIVVDDTNNEKSEEKGGKRWKIPELLQPFQSRLGVTVVVTFVVTCIIVNIMIIALLFAFY